MNISESYSLNFCLLFRGNTFLKFIEDKYIKGKTMYLG